MTAEGLNTQYRLQLANDLTPPISRQTSELTWYHLLREATKRAGGTLKTPDDETWIWSDLDLGGPASGRRHGHRTRGPTVRKHGGHERRAARSMADMRRPEPHDRQPGGRHARHDALAQEGRHPTGTARTQDISRDKQQTRGSVSRRLRSPHSSLRAESGTHDVQVGAPPSS